MLLGCDFEHLEFGANMATLTLAVVSTLTYYVCWRWSEIARVRRMAKAGRAGSSTLPSPVPLLPRWIPMIGGHSLQMETDKFNDQVEGWAEEFGGDYELFLLGTRVVIVTGTDDARRIHHLRPSKFSRGWFPGQFLRLARNVGLSPSLFFDEGKEWGRARRLISPALSGHHNVADMVPATTKIAERVCASLGDGAGETVDIVPTFERYTHDVTALAAFGFDADSLRATEERPCVSLNAMNKIATAGMALTVDPLVRLGWSMFPSLLPLARATKSTSAQLRQVVQDAIDAVRRPIKDKSGDAPSSVNGGALLRKLVSVQTDDTSNAVKGVDNRMAFSDEEIVTQVMGLFLAGSETTARTLSWTLYFLAKNPEMVSRCREEALRAAPLSDGLVSSMEEAAQLSFCSAAFKETLRIRPAATVLFLHSTEPFTMKSGLELEAETAFTTLLRYPCQSEDAFTRAKEFVPERWIDAEREEALLGKAPAGGNRSTGIVHREEVAQYFGSGPRKCPGMHMANLEATILIAALCARYDVALAPDQADPPNEVMRFTTGVTSLKLVMTRRLA
ncbi:unnamed protein product [Scytosiphon promiscuus]